MYEILWMKKNLVSQCTNRMSLHSIAEQRKKEKDRTSDAQSDNEKGFQTKFSTTFSPLCHRCAIDQRTIRRVVVNKVNKASRQPDGERLYEKNSRKDLLRNFYDKV